MLPYLSEDRKAEILRLTSGTNNEWKRELIHLLKEENPEINSLLLELSQFSSDPKAVVAAGYAVYKAIDLAFQDAFEAEK